MIVFAHGLEGSPQGAKPTAMKEAGFDIHAPDFTGMVLKDRISLLRETIMAHPGAVLCGSSYGGLACAYLAHHEDLPISGLLLLAPALGLKEAPVTQLQELAAPQGIPTILIHGTEDTICPISDSREYATRSHEKTQLQEVSDGHRLKDSLSLMLKALKELHA